MSHRREFLKASMLAVGGKALDAVETGVQVPEPDLSNHSVGKGGYPDRDGKVTLDASIMDGDGRCGAVAELEQIAHPIQVARKAMENTRHMLLVGDGALEFALQQGFKKENLLTPESEQAWREWLKQAKYRPVANSENLDYGQGLPGNKNNHDTIGMLAVDASGHLAGACITPDNLGELAACSRADEFHASAKTLRHSSMHWREKGLPGLASDREESDQAIVRALKQVLGKLE